MEQHALVECACAEATAHYQHSTLTRLQAQGPACQLASEGITHQLLAHRVTGQHYALLGEELLHPLIGHADGGSLLGEHLVGHSGIAVLLLEQHRHLQVLSRPDGSTAGVASHAHCHMGCKILDNLAGQLLALKVIVYHLHIVEQVLAVEARHLEALNLIAGLRHTLHLHPALGTHKQNLNPVHSGLKLIGNGNGGKNMTTSAAAAYQYM